MRTSLRTWIWASVFVTCFASCFGDGGDGIRLVPDAALPCGGTMEPGGDAGLDAPDAPDASSHAASSLDAAALAGDGEASGGASGGPAARPKVVFISIDGLRPDALLKAPAPKILDFACKGAYSFQAQTINPSITLPSHASMVSGFPPEVHGLYHNDWRPGHIPVPTVFSAAHKAGYRTVMVVGKDKLQQLAIPGTVDTYVFTPGGDEDVATNAIAEAARGFDLMFVHFPLVDFAGHTSGWMTEPYLRQVAATDRHVARFLETLPPGTTVIISADHGGKGFIHWSGLGEDFTIPWIINGPAVREGHIIAAPIATVDTAATVAHLLGVKLPADAIGRYVREAFRE